MKLSLFLLSAAIGNAVANKPDPKVDKEGFHLAMRFGSESEFVFCSPYWTDDNLLDETDTDENKNADGKFHPFLDTKASKIKGCFGEVDREMCKTYDLREAMTLKDLFTYTPIGSEDNIQFSVNDQDDFDDWTRIAQTNFQMEENWHASGINFFDDQSNCPSNVRFGSMFNNERSVKTTNDAIGFGATECGNHKWGGGTKVGSGTVMFPNQKDPIKGRIYIYPAEDQTPSNNEHKEPANDLMVCPGPGFSDACKATAWGDPHIVTFDGLKYDAQPAGEAIFLQSTDDSGLTIQGRIEKAREGKIPAVTTGIVTRGIEESHPVIQVATASPGVSGVGSVPVGNRECAIDLFVDGDKQDYLGYSNGNGVKVVQVGSTISIVYPSLLRVDMHTGFYGKCYFTTDFYLFDCDERSDKVIGLLGSPNGNSKDDWMDREGEVIDLPAGASKYFFGPAFNYVKENWIIKDEDESLFNYTQGQSFEKFSDPEEQFDIEYQKEVENDVSVEVIEICGDDIGCRVDFEALGSDAAEDFMANPASQRTPGARSDEAGFELAMRFAGNSEFTFCSPYWTDDVLVDEEDQRAMKDADGKFAPFLNTVASHIKGCLPRGCQVYELPTPMTLKDLFTNTPIGSQDNMQFFFEERDEALDWQWISGLDVQVQTGWMASGINYYDDQSGCNTRVRFGGIFNNEGSIKTANDAVGFGAADCNTADVGAGASIYPARKYPAMGTIWVKPAVNPPPQVEIAQPPAASPSMAKCPSNLTSRPTARPTEALTDPPTKAPSVAPVTPTDAPTNAPTQAPTEAPVVSFTRHDGDDTNAVGGGKGDSTPPKGPSSGSGDPHFKTWTGDKYDYHGECDLVLLDQPSFSNGLGLKIHIRTKRVKYFSYISNIAVQIGDEVLEFDNDVENFLINGNKVGPQRKHVRTLLSGFHVRRDPKAISIRFDDHIKAKIDLIQRKTGWPAVVVDGAETEIFKGSLGLLGDWETGKRLARDGTTEMNEPDATNFALEWQVRDTEPMLFKEARFPQYPQTCTPPTKNLSKRLGVSNFEKEALEACAHWKKDIEDCIFDVIASRDISVAEEGHIGASVA